MKKSGIIGVILTILLSGSAWAAGIWEPNKFGYAPQLTTQGTPDYGNISTSQARIDARLGKQIWVGDPNYGSTIPACVNAIGSNSVILHYSGPQAISTNLTIPANITLAPENGAILTIASWRHADHQRPPPGRTMSSILLLWHRAGSFWSQCGEIPAAAMVGSQGRWRDR